MTFFSTGYYNLSSSRLKGMEVYQREHQTIIDIDIDLEYFEYENLIQLKFVNVSDYSFDCISETEGRNIEKYKFLKDFSGFYLSLNPNEYIPGVSAHDQDFILSEQVEATLVRKF